MSYAAWRISYETSEQASQACYTYMQDLRKRMLALEAQRDEYSSKEWQAVKDLRTANKLLDKVREQVKGLQVDYQRVNTIATELEIQRDTALDSLETVKKERDLYLSILQQPKWMNALGDSIG